LRASKGCQAILEGFSGAHGGEQQLAAVAARWLAVAVTNLDCKVQLSHSRASKADASHPQTRNSGRRSAAAQVCEPAHGQNTGYHRKAARMAGTAPKKDTLTAQPPGSQAPAGNAPCRPPSPTPSPQRTLNTPFRPLLKPLHAEIRYLLCRRQ
jgi:hypothetical protein